jgi:phosphohistidine phosphatase SixA
VQTSLSVLRTQQTQTDGIINHENTKKRKHEKEGFTARFPSIRLRLARGAESAEKTLIIISHRPTQTYTDRKDRLEPYGDPDDKK